jgi:hypothetical protein
MNTLYRWMACLFSLAVLTAPAVCQTAVGYQLSGPLVHDNLAVYFLRGNGAGAAPLTLDQAVRGGQAQVRWTASDPITVENLSDRSIFVPFGTLLTGGLQDQVTSTSFLLPPHSGPVSLATYCVDPFRSTARDGEAADRLAAPGMMFPGRMAKLAMLVAAPRTRAVRRMRQSGVWWSIDSTRAQLADSLGAPVEPPRETHWNRVGTPDQVASAILAGRRSSWLTSLPLALENGALIDAQQSYANNLEAAALADDIVGAVFAVNGNLDSAEIYQSHALFAAMWPQLLRAHAVEAVASNASATPPSPQAVTAFLQSAEAGATRQGTAPSIVLRDSAAAIYLETSDRGGAWINRSIVSTTLPPAMAGLPEAMLLGMLESGHINGGELDGRPLASLGDRDVVVLRRDAAGEGWTSAIEQPEPELMLGGPGGALSLAIIGLAFLMLLSSLINPRSRVRHSRIVVSRFGDEPIVVYGARRVAARARPRPATTAVVVLTVVTRVASAARIAASVGLRCVRWATHSLAAQLAGWRSSAPTAAATALGPAWPGNFQVTSRALRARITK